ncbi:MAG: hypothetical protein ABSD62_11485 [Candidatus Limnocylindrales bacterium]|jgi:hypothetical protein
MFEAASKPAASDREIQSVGGFGIGQSPSWGVDAPDDPLDDAPDVPPDDVPDDSDDAPVPEPASEVTLDPGSLGSAFAGLVEPRSFRAQPVPLKCTAGAEMAFFIAEPHWGQAGPWPWTECMISISWPQVAQT